MQLRIVTGKGGVGKTRITLLFHQKHPKTCLWEASHALEEEADRLGMKIPKPKRTSSAELLEEFLAQSFGLKSVARFVSQFELLQNIFELAPNLDELLRFHHWKRISERNSLLVDGPSTGNFIGYFRSVKTALDFFDGGGLRKIAEEMDEFLNRATEIEIYGVALPENSALEELAEVEEELHRLYPNIRLHRILNRKHEMPEQQLALPERLHALAYKRPALEARRVSHLRFDEIVKEGATHL